MKNCINCQIYNKHNYSKYDHLPYNEVNHLNPWDEVCINMIGPWKVIIDNFENVFRALTCIDSVLFIRIVIPVENVTTSTEAQAFKDSWLSRFPLSWKCNIRDNGNEFLGAKFVFKLQRNNIKSIPIALNNPQSKYHSSYSPGEFAFGRNMIHPFAILIDWKEFLFKGNKIR